MKNIEKYWQGLYDELAVKDIPDWQRSCWWSYDTIVSQERFLKKHLPVISGNKLKIADIGSGPGYYCKMLSDMGHDVLGLDYSYETVRAAATKDYKYGVSLCQGDAGYLPLKDGSFDLALAFGILQISADPLRQLKELSRILKTGGQIILSTPVQHRLWELPFFPVYCLLACDGFPSVNGFKLKLIKRRATMQPRPSDDQSYIINRYPLKKLRADLINSGFSGIHIRYQGRGPHFPWLVNSFVVNAVAVKKDRNE